MPDNTSYQTGGHVEDETLKLFSDLRALFQVNNDAAVLRRALALARIVAREAKDDHTITIERRDGTQVTLMLDA